MDRTPVSSSNIAAVGYDPDTMTLEVEFNSGKIYQYFDVPEVIFTEILGASSPGGYFNQNVKGSYRCVKL